MGLLKFYSTALFSLLAGAAAVHTLYKPDLRLPVELREPDRGA